MTMFKYQHIRTRAAALLLALVCTVFTGCKDDDAAGDGTGVAPTVKVINVDIVLPKNIQQQWQNSIDWAVTNIEQAQVHMPQKVKLNLRYHDEDTENLDQLAYKLTTPEAGDDTCHAIIGPYHSTHAQTLLNYAAATRLPVVMPTCTSSELQRIHARNTYAWFLTESDITQCEIMLSCARSVEASDVALIHSDDNYGKSFKDWFGYYATEFQVNVAGDGLMAYSKGASIDSFLDNICKNTVGQNVLLCVAVNSPSDYVDIQKQLENYLLERMREAQANTDREGNAIDPSLPTVDDVIEIIPLFADTSCDEAFLSQCDESSIAAGITPYGSLDYGFPQAYYATYGRRPHNGEAQIYDALSIIALGAFYQMMSPDSCIVDNKKVSYNTRPYEAGLTDYMRAVVSRKGYNTSWDEWSLSETFTHINVEADFSLHGATGGLDFDIQTHTKVLNTTYMLWQTITGADGRTELDPIIYLSTAGTSSQASTTNIWEQEKRWLDENFADDVNPELEELTDRWAVVITPSTTWSNYRHQADAFAMYQLLRRSGYDDDHIVLIVEDNLANDANNKFPGKIYVERPYENNDQNVDVRQDAVVDYHFTDITREDLADIMLGRQSERLPQVIHPTSTSNVFFFWSGHGGSYEGPLWGNGDARDYFGKQRIRDVVEEMNRNGSYRRMFFAIETCFSGHWGEVLTGLPNLIVVTAANNRETSDADVHDATLGVFLSNAFTRTFRKTVTERPGISIYELYKELARTTIGSHVSLFNQSHYGSVYTNTLEEYFSEIK